MSAIGIFPFGEPVKEVIQTDRTPKRVFILGVHGSGVHTRWLDSNGCELVKALQVASEPYIFWCGENAEAIIDNINVGLPDGVGKLVLPTDTRLNGPSGKTLDEYFLIPLNLDRSQVWLCDLVPYACMNKNQLKAIKREYFPLNKEYNLPEPSVPEEASKFRFVDKSRRDVILGEIEESRAEILVLLGNDPIKWFLRHFDEERRKELRDFGKGKENYGRLHSVTLSGTKIEGVLPLVHPRQSAALGKSDREWRDLHHNWITSTAPNLIPKLSN